MRRGQIGLGVLAIASALSLTAATAATVGDARAASSFGALRAFHVAQAECAVTGTIADGKSDAGAPLYAKRCARCHGVDGDGKGKATKMIDAKPTAFNSKEAWAKTTLKVKFQSTKCGGKAVGQSGAMPDYPEYTDQQIWDLLAYMQMFQSGAGKTRSP